MIQERFIVFVSKIEEKDKFRDKTIKLGLVENNLLLTKLCADNNAYFFIYYPEFKSFDYKDNNSDIRSNISLEQYLKI